MSRLRTVIVLFAVVAAGLVAPSEARAASVGVLDRDVVALDASRTSFTRTSGPEDVVSATVSPTNQIVLTTADPNVPPVTLTLGDGTRPQPGGYYLLNSTTKNSVTGICGGISGGHLAVAQVVYSGDTVTELSATYGTSCSALGYSSGAIRVGVTDPYAVVRPPTAAMGRVPGGRQNVTTVTFANTGEATTGTLGPATVGTNIVGVTDFSIVTDHCEGQALAPGEACTVDVGFRRDTNGTSTSLVKVPDQTYPGRQLVTGITATAVMPPSPPSQVLPFPVRGGEGVSWGTAGGEVESYRVVKQVAGAWVDASGLLPAAQRTWVDTTLASGASATYAVVAANFAGASAPSSPASGVRPPTDAVVGDVDELTMDVLPDDLNAGAQAPMISRGPLTSSGAKWSYVTLTSDTMSVGLPALLRGPGKYRLNDPFGPLDTSFDVRGLGCVGPTDLDVAEVSYGSDASLESIAATYRMTGCSGGTVVGQIRYHSTSRASLLGITPVRSDLPTTHVGEPSPTAQIDVSNLGDLPVSLGSRTLAGPGAEDWSVVSDSCGDALAPAGVCSVTVRAVPTAGGDRDVMLAFTDSTPAGSHRALVKLHAIGLPSAPTAVTAVRLPFGGVDLTWDLPTDPGGLDATRWFVRRQSNGTETDTSAPARNWVDQSAPSDAAYSVAMENSVGEGPASQPVTPSEAVDVLVVKDNVAWNSPTPKLAGIAVDGGRQTVPWPVPGLPDAVAGATASPDGRSVVSIRWSTDGSELWRHPVDNSTAPAKVWSTTSQVVRVAWSPDGTRLAVGTEPSNNCCPYTSVVIDAKTGAVLSSIANLRPPTWLPDSRTLVADDDLTGTLTRVDATTGRRIGPVSGSPSGNSPTVSPDGRWLTYQTGISQQLAIAPLAGGTARTIPLNGAGTPQWSPDSRSIIVSASYFTSGTYRIAVGEDGTPGAPEPLSLVTSGQPEVLAWVGRHVAIGVMPALTGPVATVPVLMTSFPAGTSLSCAVDSGAFTPCSTSWKTPSLTTGTHTVRARTVEPGGRTTVAARTIVVDATAPTAKTTAMPLALLATTTSLRFSATDAGGSTVTSYDVRYRYASPTGAFTALSQPAGWQGLRSTTLALALAKGYSYCFAVRARDAVGNVGAWTAETCTNVALDDRSLSGTGWTRGTSASYYLGTYTTVATSGRVLSARVSARQVGIVVTTCSTCGVVDVRLAGAYLGRKSLASSTARAKQILWLAYGVTRTGTLSLTTVGGKRVYVDGVVLRH